MANGQGGSPFKLVSTREVYRNPWLSLREDHVIRPGGEPGVFGVVEMRAGSTVLPFLPSGRVVLVEEYKYAIGRPSIELISGGMDEGEGPLEAARRELLEEAGLAAPDWQEVGLVNPFTTVISSPNFMFIARGARFQPGHAPEAGHRLREIEFQDAVRMVSEGEITHAASCVLILKAALLAGV
jgi:ADP-ribose pyrophosphatase